MIALLLYTATKRLEDMTDADWAAETASLEAGRHLHNMRTSEGATVHVLVGMPCADEQWVTALAIFAADPTHAVRFRVAVADVAAALAHRS